MARQFQSGRANPAGARIELEGLRSPPFIALGRFRQTAAWDNFTCPQDGPTVIFWSVIKACRHEIDMPGNHVFMVADVAGWTSMNPVQPRISSVTTYFIIPRAYFSVCGRSDLRNFAIIFFGSKPYLWDQRCGMTEMSSTPPRVAR
jgi:hypothetical protein